MHESRSFTLGRAHGKVRALGNSSILSRPSGSAPSLSAHPMLSPLKILCTPTFLQDLRFVGLLNLSFLF